MSRKIGINVVSMVPFSLGRGGLARALGIASEAGFDGLQLLPLRFWNAFTFFDILKEKIISFELAWNCGSIWGAILRHSHLTGEENPTLKDWILFGKCETVEDCAELIFRNFQKTSMFVTHDTVHAGVIEMHPELEMMADDYADYHHGLVWDTEHVLRFGHHGEPPVTLDWIDFLEEVKGNIHLIHAKPFSMFHRKEHEYEAMLTMLGEKTKCPVIFEGKPPFSTMLSRRKMISWLKEQRTFLSYFF
jgi:hypothetical protein